MDRAALGRAMGAPGGSDFVSALDLHRAQRPGLDAQWRSRSRGTESDGFNLLASKLDLLISAQHGEPARDPYKNP